MTQTKTLPKIPDLYTSEEIKQTLRDDKKTKLYPGRAFDLGLPLLERLSLPKHPSPNPQKSSKIKQRNALIRKVAETPLKCEVSEYKLQPKQSAKLQIERIPQLDAKTCEILAKLQLSLIEPDNQMEEQMQLLQTQLLQSDPGSTIDKTHEFVAVNKKLDEFIQQLEDRANKPLLQQLQRQATHHHHLTQLENEKISDFLQIQMENNSQLKKEIEVYENECDLYQNKIELLETQIAEIHSKIHFQTQMSILKEEKLEQEAQVDEMLQTEMQTAKIPAHFFEFFGVIKENIGKERENRKDIKTDANLVVLQRLDKWGEIIGTIEQALQVEQKLFMGMEKMKLMRIQQHDYRLKD